ncbi:MAG: 2OG-Fe(II) oxygenase [Gammaproteobacteria bacterium]|nr:2OG-Fe(II) oxygenase [Gammaproteobacteria bacterium]
MSTLTQIKYGHVGWLQNSAGINKNIMAGFKQYADQQLTHKSHFFEGRYENIYIDREKIPELQLLIAQATAYVAEILETDAESLQCGFWFNSMQHGDVTIAHTHDDDDELMSGVYYVEAPENSGQLQLGVGPNLLEIEPEAGKMVFFRPDIIHQVSRNCSSRQRLSIGMNFGLKKEFKPE